MSNLPGHRKHLDGPGVPVPQKDQKPAEHDGTPNFVNTPAKRARQAAEIAAAKEHNAEHNAKIDAAIKLRGSSQRSGRGV